MKTANDIFIENLIRLRKKHAKQDEFFTKVGFKSVRGYQKYEQGESIADVEMIERFAKALSVEPWELLHPSIGEAPNTVSGEKPEVKAEISGGLSSSANSVSSDERIELLRSILEIPGSDIPGLIAFLRAEPPASLGQAKRELIARIVDAPDSIIGTLAGNLDRLLRAKIPKLSDDKLESPGPKKR